MKVFENLVIHDELNKDIFDENHKMHPAVRDRLLAVVDYFLHHFLDFTFPVLDVVLVGSSASYNYTDTSDLDLHIVTNFDGISCNNELIQELMNAEKAMFNLSYNIMLKGREVEVYIEDVRAGAVSNGIYSLVKDEWIKFPQAIEAKSFDTAEDVEIYKVKIEDAIQNGTSDEVQAIVNDLYLQRKNSIAADGEYGYGNQVFKDVRSLGLLDALKQAYKEKKSGELTLETLEQ